MAEVFSPSLMIERNEMIEVTRMQQETGGLQADTTSRTGCENRTRRRDSSSLRITSRGRVLAMLLARILIV